MNVGSTDFSHEVEHSLTENNFAEDQENISNVRQRKKKKYTSTRDSTTYGLKHERKRANELMQRILSAKHRTMCDQQCELDDMRRKLFIFNEENRYLREQNHMQSAIIDKLDGKNAKIPLLMNSQMEEIRIYREQLRRLKEIFLRTNKARQEADNARQKSEDELQHLRGLAFSQHLPEREELLAAVTRLQGELENQEKDKNKLERYSANLEKNQRCERNRLLKSQKDLQYTCSLLTESVRNLQISLQEKQKIIDIQQMHMQRCLKTRTANTTNALDEKVLANQPKSLETAKPTHLIEKNAEKKEFQQQTDILSTKDSITAKETYNYVPVQIKKPFTGEEKKLNFSLSMETSREISKGQPKFKSGGIVIKTLNKRPKTSSQSLPRKKVHCNSPPRPKSSTSHVVIPTVSHLKSDSSDQLNSEKPKHIPFTNTDGKIVNFSWPIENSQQDETFELLRANEKLARLVAEAKMQVAEIELTKPIKKVQIANNDLQDSSPSTHVKQSSYLNEGLPKSVSHKLTNNENDYNECASKKLSELVRASCSNVNQVHLQVSAGGDLPELVEQSQNKIKSNGNSEIFPTTSRPAQISNLIREMCYKELMDKQVSQEIHAANTASPRLKKRTPAVNSPKSIAEDEKRKTSFKPRRMALKRRVKYSGRSSTETSAVTEIQFNTKTKNNLKSNNENDVLTSFSDNVNPIILQSPVSPILRLQTETNSHENNERIHLSPPTNLSLDGIGTRLASTLFSTSNLAVRPAPSYTRNMCSQGCRETLLPCIHHRHQDQN